MISFVMGVACGWFLGIASVFIAVIWAYRKGAGL